MLNRLDALLTPKVDPVVKLAAVSRSAVRRRRSPEILQEEFVRQVIIERIKKAQEEEKWIANLKEFLIGDITKLSVKEAKLCARIAYEYELDGSGLLFSCPRSTGDPNIRVEMVCLVIPELLQQDFLHHYHTSLEGGHQGIGRTYQRIQSNCHWRGLYPSVQRYVKECVDCTTGEGKPVLRGKSSGNVQATYPF